MKKLFEMLKGAPKAKVAKLAYAFIGVVVSGAILIAATTSMAWFSQNRRTDASEMEIKANDEGTVATYEVFKYDLENENVVKTTNTSVQLNTHDAVFLSENAHNPVFIRLQITTKNANLEEGRATLEIARSSTDHELSKMLSSVGRFSCSTAVDYEGAATDEDVYNVAKNYFCNPNGSMKTSPVQSSMFISGSAGNYAKADSITLDGSDVEKSGGDTTTFYLTLCICYDTYYSEHLAVGDTYHYLDSESVQFAVENDISNITILLS